MTRMHIVLAAAAAFAAAAVVLLLRLVGDGAAWSDHLGPPGVLGGLLVGFVLTETLTSHVQVRRDSYTFSIGEVPMVLGLAFVSPIALVAVRLVGAGAAGAWRRVPAYKLAFNLSVFALETAVAATVVAAIGGTAGSTRYWLVLGASVSIANLVNAAALAFVISLFQPDSVRRVIVVALRSQFLYLLNTGLAVLVAIAASASWVLATIGLVPVVGLLVAARLSESMQKRYDQLDVLYGFTSALGARESDDLLPTALAEIQRLLNVEVVEILLFATERSAALRIAMDEDGREMQALDPNGMDATRLAGIEEPTVLGTEAEIAAVLGAFERPIHECLVLPVRKDGTGAGVVIAANRLGTSRAFKHDDLAVGAAIVNHLAIVLESSVLVGQLDELSRLDPVTGLLNGHGLDAALGAWSLGVQHGALCVELQDFKDVNDALGRSVADELLRGVAERILAEVGDAAIVARVDSTEFNVVLDDCERIEITDRANRLVDALRRPFAQGGLRVSVMPVVGIAVATSETVDLPMLLQRATAAIADAKRDGQSSAFSSLEHTQDGRRRLVLAASLPDALEQHAISVFYQPKIEIATGAVTGAEALLRWTHPDYGPIPPPDIVDLAERAGLIRPLTDYVLRAALTEVAVARSQGHAISIAVNLSPKDLLDQQLPATVKALLAEMSMPADALQLELTEGSIMTDPRRAITLLEELADLGILLSVDDYGTGYSSLSYLRRLPIHQLKIDKSFVVGLGELGRADRGDEVIVRSTIDLGHNLGLQVVAEGVETAESLAILKDLQCDYAQGYYYSRPIPAEAFHAWLADRAGGRPRHLTVA